MKIDKIFGKIKLNDFLVFILLLSIAFLIYIRIISLPVVGFSGDFGYFNSWSASLRAYGFAGFYQHSGCNYLPLYVYILRFSQIIQHFMRPFFHNFSSDQIISISYKIPCLIFDILCGVLIYKIVATKFKEKLMPTLAMMLYFLHPALFHWTYIFGQNNVLLYFPTLLTLYGVLNKKTYLGGVGLAILLLTKPTSIVLVPFIFVLSLIIFKKDYKKYLQFYGTGIIIIQILILPFIGMRTLWDYARSFIYFLAAGNGFKVTEMGADNFWYIISKGQSISDAIKFHGLSYNLWGMILFSFSYLIVLLLTLLNKGKNAYLLATIILFCFFNFPTRVHEGYLLFAFPVFIVSIFLEWNLFSFLIYIISTILYTMNLWFVWPWYCDKITNSCSSSIVHLKSIFEVPIAYVITLVPLLLTIIFIIQNRKTLILRKQKLR